MKILISAAETSSDAHGAHLLQALREQGHRLGMESVQAFGIGGPKLQAAGLKTIVDARELLAMGFFEILSRLPRIGAALRQVTEAARQERPDVAVVIDYPDFHFRLARKLRALNVPVVYYIPPKVWVWRKKRIHVLRDSFVRVLSILPFEVPFYEKEKVPVRYVGNPLVDELPLQMSRAEARAKLGLGEADRVLVLLPGSRPSELKQNMGLMLDAAVKAAQELRSQGVLSQGQRLKVLLPFAVTSDLAVIRMSLPAADTLPFDLHVSQGDAHECMIAADAGLIKSGTSTLEAAILGCPHAIVYKVNWLSEFMFFHVVKYQGPVGLSNLVAGSEPGKPLLVHEILCSQVTVEALTAEILSLFSEARREELKRGLAEVRARIVGSAGEAGVSPSAQAALEILKVVQERAKVQRGLDC